VPDALPTPSRRRRRAVLGAALALVLLVAACGGDDEEGNVVGDVTEDSALPTQVAPTTLASVAGEECKEATDVPEFEGKPVVEMPAGQTIDELTTIDITVGDGAEAALDKEITVNYVGIACSTGMEFDTSWVEGGQPATFTLSEGALIDGWIEGLPGMKVGGRRMLLIPSDMAYGPEGNQGIAPDEALVFVIDLLEVAEPAPAEDPTATSAPAEGDATTTTAAEGDATTTTAAEG
jgi:peptidylprolyl isomerase